MLLILYPAQQKYKIKLTYCQAQSQLQLNWTELVLVSINPIRPPGRQASLPE